MLLFAADDLPLYSTLITVAGTLLTALISGIWGVSRWSQERKDSRKQEERLAQERLAQEERLEQERLEQEKRAHQQAEQLAQDRLEQQRIEERHRREDKVADLIIALGNAENAEARLWTASALALYPKETLPLLTAALGHAEETTSSVINIALASIGPQALPELIKMNRVAQMIVSANANASSTGAITALDLATPRQPGGAAALAGGNGHAETGAPGPGEEELARDAVPSAPNTDVSGASRLVEYSKAAIAYLVLQCQAEELCKLDLADVDLSSMSFARARLDGVHFRKACLTNANFAHTHLTGANFRGAGLKHANLLNATVRRADFTGAKGPIRAIRMEATGSSFQDAELGASILDGARLKDATLVRTELAGASLRGAVLSGSTISNANWSHIDAQKSGLSHCTFIHVRMVKADLRQANVSASTFTGTCRLSRLTAAGIIGRNASFTETDFAGSDFTGADFRGATFVRCVLSGVRFDQAVLEECVFDRCTLYSVSFAQAKLKGARFTGAQRSKAENLDVTGANWQEAIFENGGEDFRALLEQAFAPPVAALPGRVADGNGHAGPAADGHGGSTASALAEDVPAGFLLLDEGG